MAPHKPQRWAGLALFPQTAFSLGKVVFSPVQQSREVTRLFVRRIQSQAPVDVSPRFRQLVVLFAQDGQADQGINVLGIGFRSLFITGPRACRLANSLILVAKLKQQFGVARGQLARLSARLLGGGGLPQG
jgi:hypothetical protein